MGISILTKESTMRIIRNLIHSDLSLIKEFRDNIINLLEEEGYDENFIFKIRLVLDELIINSYKHGNNKIYEKLIDIIIVVDEGSCMVKVRDEGDGIDYCKDRDMLSDHGRGIQLVYTLADNFWVKDNTTVAFLELNDQKVC